MNKSAIAIIPARGGSKRIPGKNIIDFLGKPMIAWTIEAALNSNLFEKIIVSTDDEKIAEISRAYGADVPFLREDYSDDLTPVSKATVSALKQAEIFFDSKFPVVVQLMPNCPLRSHQDIHEAFDKFKNSKTDFQISCFPYLWMNPWWAVELSTDGRPKSIFPDALKMRSQDLPPLYCPTGAIWIGKRDPLLKAESFYGEGHTFFPIDWKSAMDIDTYDDLVLAKALANPQPALHASELSTAPSLKSTEEK